MTDNEIIKAMEWHLNDETHCSSCPYEEHSVTHFCVEMVIKDALDLINRQQEEIERLQGKVDMYEEERKYHFEMSRQRIAEAVKEFAERLKAVYINDKRYDRPNPHTLLVRLFAHIDDIEKEMVGDSNAE